MDRGAGEQRVQKQRQQPQRTAQPVPLREKGEMLCERQNKADLDQLRGLHRQSSGQHEPRGVVGPVHAHAEDKDRRSQQRCGSCGKVPLPDQPAVVRKTEEQREHSSRRSREQLREKVVVAARALHARDQQKPEACRRQRVKPEQGVRSPEKIRPKVHVHRSRMM